MDPDHLVNSLSDESPQESYTAEEKPEEEPEEEPKKEIQEAANPVLEKSQARQMGRLVYREDGKYCQTDPLPLVPGCETYYYTKYCFGKKDANGRLYTLVGNEWRYGGPFMSYYFDAQYDYWEVDYILEPNSTIP